MKQGNQFYLEIQIEDDKKNLLNIDLVSKVQFTIDNIIKTYDGINNEVLYDKEKQCFKIWLKEEETFDFENKVKIDARILFINDSIDGTYIIAQPCNSALSKEVLDVKNESNL